MPDPFDQRLDDAVLHRLQQVGELEPFTSDWDTAFHEASKPLFEVQQAIRDAAWAEYVRVWGKGATGSYFQCLTASEVRAAEYRVFQRLAALAPKPLAATA